MEIGSSLSAPRDARTSSATAPAGVSTAARRTRPSLPAGIPPALFDHLRRYWFLWAAVLTIAVPTFVSIARISWSTEQGAHGPIVLATGIWLVAQRRREVAAIARRGSPWVTAAVLIPSLLLYTFARITDVLEVEGFALYFALVATFYAYAGKDALKLLWFPAVYFLFLFPPPDTLVWTLTQPLKLGISAAVVNLLDLFGMPVARAGVTIQVDQYQLLVAAACAGLNSLISLSAIGLFYVYLRHNANWRYALLLMAAIVPVAILANFIRVLLLVLITYFFGDAAAQGFLHNFAGVTMFAAAVLGVFAVDALAAPLRRRLGGHEAEHARA